MLFSNGLGALLACCDLDSQSGRLSLNLERRSLMARRRCFHLPALGCCCRSRKAVHALLPESSLPSLDRPWSSSFHRFWFGRPLSLSAWRCPSSSAPVLSRGLQVLAYQFQCYFPFSCLLYWLTRVVLRITFRRHE